MLLTITMKHSIFLKKYFILWYWHQLGNPYLSILRMNIKQLWLLPLMNKRTWEQRIEMYGDDPWQLKFHVPSWFLQLSTPLSTGVLHSKK